MKFWISAAYWSCFVACGMFVAFELPAQFTGRDVAIIQAAEDFLYLWALFLSGVVCLFFWLHRNTPQIVRLTAWLKKMMGKTV